MRVITPNNTKINKSRDSIATVIASHKNDNILKRCCDNVKRHVGDEFFVLADGASWNQFEKAPFPRIRGYIHGLPRAPYRNLTVALKAAVEKWAGKTDWLLYCEYDVEFCNDYFREDLSRNATCIGFDHRTESMNVPLINSIYGKEIRTYHYLLGACVFHRMSYLERLAEKGFFDRFLSVTEFLPPITFPGYDGYDLGEHLYPTLAAEYGDVIGLTQWTRWANTWTGKRNRYQVRWKPEVATDETFPGETSIIHPRKS